MCGEGTILEMLFILLIGSFSRSQGTENCPAGSLPFAQDPGIDDSGEVGYARLFSVSYHGTYKVVRYDPVLSKYKSSWPEASQRGQTIPDLVLWQCGTPKPTSSHIEVNANARFYQIPLQKVAVGWSGVLHFVEMLSATQAISKIDLTHITSPCAQLLEICTPGIHESIMSTKWAEDMNDIEVVFTDSFGTGWSNSTRDVVFDVSLDAGILHRAEWVKFLAVFFNKEREAADIFSRIEADYTALEQEAVNLKDGESRPKIVAWAQWQGCKDVACHGIQGWTKTAAGNMCRCGSFYIFSNAHFKRDVVKSAGGRLLSMPSAVPVGCRFITISDGSQSYECDATELQHFQLLLSQADVIFDETHSPNHQLYTLDDFYRNFELRSLATPLKAMTNEAVFRTDRHISDPRESDGKVGNAWYEQMPAQPQQLLSDTISALWGDAFKGSCDLKYLRHLHSGMLQTINKHTDCAAYSPTGHHSCAAIHSHEHEIPKCAAEVGGSDSDESKHSLALGLGFGLALGVSSLVMCILLVLSFRYRQEVAQKVICILGFFSLRHRQEVAQKQLPQSRGVVVGRSVSEELQMLTDMHGEGLPPDVIAFNAAIPTCGK